MSNGSNRGDRQPSNSATTSEVDEDDFDPLEHGDLDLDLDIDKTSSEDEQPDPAPAIAPSIQGGTSFPTVHARVLTGAEISKLHSRNLQLEQEVLDTEHVCRLCDENFQIDAPQVCGTASLQNKQLTKRRFTSITSSTN